MKTLNQAIRLKAWILTLAAFVSLSLTAIAAQAQTTQKTETSSTWQWQWTDDGWKKRMEIRGKAELMDDYSDIKSVSEGGLVTIEEVRGGTARRLEITRGADGQLRRTYYLQGQAREIDAATRSWAAGLLLEAVRKTALDADKRLQRIFERRGLNGALEEIALSEGDYAKRRYFEALLKNRNLNASTLQTIYREVARQMSSDHEQAQLLIATADALTDKSQALPAFFEATSAIKSDYDRRRVLSAMLKRSASNQDILLGVLRTAASITSDHDKGNVLKEAARFELDNARVASAYFQAVDTITSDHERRGVLAALLKGKRGAAVLSRMLESAARMSSDYEKATFLVQAASAYEADDKLREAFLKTVNTIKSDHDRGRVLSAMQSVTPSL